MTPEKKALEIVEKVWKDTGYGELPKLMSALRWELSKALLDARREARLETIEECAGVAADERAMRERLYLETENESNFYRAFGALSVQDAIRALAKTGDGK